MNEMKPYNGDVCLEARVRVVEALLEERKEMLKLTASALQERLVLLNELRTEVMTKGEYVRAHEVLTIRIEVIEKLQSKMIGIGIALVALSGLLGAYLGHLIR